MLQLERNESHLADAETGRVYVYGIIRGKRSEEKFVRPPLENLFGTPIRMVSRDGVAALVASLGTLVSGVPFEEAVKDPEQAKSLILDHHRVLQHLMGKGTVLPMRFGALFADDEEISDALHEHRQVLLQSIDRVDGAREWGVKIYCDRSILHDHLGEDSQAILTAQGELSAAREGRAFFLHRRIARLADEELQRSVANCVEASRQRLRDAARADAQMKLQPMAIHGRNDEMVWNGTFLVAERAEERFFAVIDELMQLHGPRGFHHEANGPWPPFSFATCRLGEDENDCSNGA